MIRKSDWLLLFLILSTFVVGIIVYPQMPDQVPMHWNIQGEVDRYGGKFQGTFMLPLMILGLFFLFLLLPKLDPRKENYQGFKRTYGIIQWSIQFFLVVMYFLTLYHSLVPKNEIPKFLQISFAVPFLVSVLFIVLGNYMGKVKDNFFVGIRNPWTLSSKEVWYKTHRLASKLFVISGILGIIGSFFGGSIAFIMLLGPVILSVILPMIYSYVIYRKELKK
ncbi:SdpI family protein [Tepidibacillus fermentans]|uniref:Putative membrane protein n=1 Tax=Tepidibacillus fermentans TaxID=1281767 RepID=A0A4R3KJF6_9BACI|nr:SdpI family protein [Tepidibacillus fermentans]TCS83820.1 putative membrane protein [Tepidibacillus fermentans]